MAKKHQKYAYGAARSRLFAPSTETTTDQIWNKNLNSKYFKKWKSDLKNQIHIVKAQVKALAAPIARDRQRLSEISKKLAREDVTGYPLAELQATFKELATKIDIAARAKKSKQKELNALNKSIDSFFNKGIAKIYNGLDTGKLRLTGMRKNVFFELKKGFINLSVAIANGTIQAYDRIRQLFDKAYLGCCKIIILLKGYSIKSNTTAKLANPEKTGLSSNYNKAVNNLESCDNVVKYRQQELKYAEN